MPLQCIFCKLSLDSADALAAHQSMHVEGSKKPNHYCTLCSYSANGVQKLGNHMRTHRGGVLYYCLHCPFIASNLTAYTRHKSTHSPQENPSTETIGFKNSLAESEVSSQEMDTENENENYSSAPKSGYYNNYDNDDNAPENILQPEIGIQVKQEILYACSTCNFNTTSSSEMEEHLDEAEEDELYTCDECDLTFCSFRSVAMHRETHSDENSEDSFQFQNAHPENPVRVNSSGLPFPDEPMQSSNGTTAMFLDPNQNPSGNDSGDDASDPDWFRARTRSRRRRSKPVAIVAKAIVPLKPGSSTAAGGTSGNLVKASNSLPKIESMKEPAKAEASSKKTKNGSQKLKSSNQYSKMLARRTCMFCSKVFTCPSSLKIHIRSHTGEKPFKCPKCSFSASQKGNLRAHLETHNGILVKCQFCNYTGTRASAVNAHIRADHSNVDKLRLEEMPELKREVLNPGSSILPKIQKPAGIRNKFRSKSLAVTRQKSLGQVAKQEPQDHSQFNGKPRTLNETVPIQNKGFHCNLCNITCKSVETFRRHDCTGTKYGCSQCSYTTRFKNHLKRHWKTHKSGVLESCPDCNYKTSSTRGLVFHFREAGHGKKY